jgi:NTE family protein
MVKKFLIFLALFFLNDGIVYAKQRPTVGLVLSGGGARGGAHVGVLKFLEEKHIPIDYIVGTSMGSFMGGLYASGYSADELKDFLINTKWENYVTSKKPRIKIPFRQKLLSMQFPGNIKIGINGDNEISLPTGVFEKQMMLGLLRKKLKNVLYIKDFTKLPIPYTAIATELSNGEMVELASGDLSKSIYASMCVPGGFEPIEIDGKILVDGGISSNLPVETMRKLFHPDYIIVVDISTPFEKNQKFNSYDEVISQQIDILTRRNVENTIKSLKPNEILISPELEGYSFLDADKYAEIIQKGYETAKKDFNKISFLSVDNELYEQYTKKHRFKPTLQLPVIDAIEIDNNTFISDNTIRYNIHQQIGKEFDFEQLQKDLLRIYYMMYFSSVDFKLVRKNAKNVLVIITKPAWNAHGDIRAGLAFEDDFNGHSDYQFRLEYNKYNLDSYGGEWRNRLEVGKRKLIKTEIYQPLDYKHITYFISNVYYEKVKHYVTPHSAYEDVKNEDKTLPLYSTNYGGILGFGINLGTTSGFEIGFETKKVQPSMDIFFEQNGEVVYETIEESQRLSQVYMIYAIDSLDNPFFPQEGFKAKAKYYKNIKVLNSSLKYSQLYGEISYAFSIGRSTIVPFVKYGKTYNAEDFKDSQDISAYYHLGGLFNISGRSTYHQTGDEMFFGSLNYRYSVVSNKFLNSITSAAYIGASVETGKAWYNYNENFNTHNLLFGSSVYFAIDTILGPFYFAYGYSDTNHQTVYFSLGKSY